jgi:hypothetical protein
LTWTDGAWGGEDDGSGDGAAIWGTDGAISLIESSEAAALAIFSSSSSLDNGLLSALRFLLEVKLLLLWREIELDEELDE